MIKEEIKQFILDVFNKTIGNIENVTPEICARYFSQDYIQYVDGRALTFNEFVAHMNTLKKVMTSIKIDFKHILIDGNKVATLHIVNGIKKNGDKVKAQVNAIIEIRDKKIVMCDELTHILEGNKSDHDLGSRY